jgi:hypothetical protein
MEAAPAASTLIPTRRHGAPRWITDGDELLEGLPILAAEIVPLP